ncbi:MAG: segregation/condensation protein A [Clostridiales bacterium]|jgi:segregation and condensation protein A|nr:segregation/condensation protein A [Clostridiales bacterium]
MDENINNSDGLNAKDGGAEILNPESSRDTGNPAANGAEILNPEYSRDTGNPAASGAEILNPESSRDTGNPAANGAEILNSGFRRGNGDSNAKDDGAGFLHSGLRHEFKLRFFEGPLDLLLALIKEAKIDIKDIFVSEITNQYIEYVAQMDTFDLDYVGEFIEMAATLLEIKSKKLLPKIEKEKTDEEIHDESWLIRQLEEYKVFKETSELLKKRETTGVFYREPDYDENDYKTVFKNFSMEKLIEAFAVILHREGRRVDEHLTRKIIKERFTVANRVIFITELLKEKRKVNFFSLFEDDYSKTEVINIFLAILEILKKQIAFAEQDEYYSDIFLTAASAIDSADAIADSGGGGFGIEAV